MKSFNKSPEYKDGYNACLKNFKEESLKGGVIELCFHKDFKGLKSDFDCGWVDALIEIAKRGRVGKENQDFNYLPDIIKCI